MEKQWRDMIQQIRQPKIILILVFIIGLSLDGSLYLYKVMPQFVSMHNISVQHDLLEKQRLVLEKSPTPPRILPKQIQALVEQVPISKNSAAFLISLRDLELSSGIVIESVSDGTSSKKDAINELITPEGKANIPNANYNTQKSKDAVSGANSTTNGTTPAPNGTATTPSTTAGFAPSNLELSILGSYSELMGFMNRLAELPRFVKVNEWAFGDSTSLISPGQNLGGLFNDPASTPDSSAISNKKRLTLKLAIYSAAQFKNQFPDLPPISLTADPQNRLDPTLTDDQFNKILDSLRENKIK